MRKRRHGRGFFIIWGSRNRVTSDGKGSIQGHCPRCRKVCTLHGKQLRRWFTLYFLPVFPMGAGERFTECGECKSQFVGTLEQMGARAAAAGPSVQDAIVLYNEMRETPTDAMKLEKLLRVYLEVGEPGEAVSAGRTYGAAMEGSDGCLAAMAVALLRVGDREGAARHAAAALALNPGNVEAAGVEKGLRG